MFRWYKQAAKCYAYLADVHYDGNGPVDLEKCKFNGSRWFTRGWTLQELIAPSNVDFKSSDWHQLGTKDELQEEIENITGIDVPFLSAADLDLASTAKKMSWAAHRQSSRIEDQAYSLLGIFDVNLPLIYGEGKKAFQRLQEAILRDKPEDHSLYAWGSFVQACSFGIGDEEVPIPMGHASISEPLLGLLAESPRDFAESGDIAPLPWAIRFYTDIYNGWEGASLPFIVGKAVKVALPSPNVIPTSFCYKLGESAITQVRPGIAAGLLCQSDKYGPASIYIPLLKWGYGYVGRTREIVISPREKVTEQHVLDVFTTTKHFHVMAERRLAPVYANDVVMRQVKDYRVENEDHGQFAVAHGRAIADRSRIIHSIKSTPGSLYAYQASLCLPQNPDARFNVVIGHQSQPGSLEGLDLNLHVGISIFLDPITDGNDRFAAVPLYEHTFASPADQWYLLSDQVPPISIAVERVEMSSAPRTYFDVFDYIVWDPTMLPPPSLLPTRSLDEASG